MGQNPSFWINAILLSRTLATQFKYDGADDLEIVRTDFVPDSLPVLAVEYQVRNKTNQPKEILLSLTADTDLSPVWLGDVVE